MRVCVCVCVSVAADDLITMVGVVVFVLDKYVYGGTGVEEGGGGGGWIVDRGSWCGDVLGPALRGHEGRLVVCVSGEASRDTCA